MKNNFVFYANLLDMDECASDPCQNNATCDDLINEFRCDCVPGFNGTLCGNSKRISDFNLNVDVPINSRNLLNYLG